MITIEYLGESKNGRVCSRCGGKPADLHITRKKIFNRLWEIGKPQAVNLSEFDMYMATGLFRKVR